MNNIKIPISIGELIDKLSILKIKLEKIDNEEKLNYIKNEFNLLMTISSEFLSNNTIKSLYEEIYEVNKKLWDVEDLIRKKEILKEFDYNFIELSRAVYITNDIRFNIKNKINEFTNSEIKEQKSY